MRGPLGGRGRRARESDLGRSRGGRSVVACPRGGTGHARRAWLALAFEPAVSGHNDCADLGGLHQPVRPIAELMQNAPFHQMLDLFLGGIESFRRFLERTKFADS